MLGGRHVIDEMDVVRPWKLARIERSADQKAPPGQSRGRADEELLEPLLPIGGPRAEVGEVGQVAVNGLDRLVRGRIDRAIQWCSAFRAETCLQLIERAASGVAENEIETGQPSRCDVLHLFPPRDA